MIETMYAAPGVGLAGPQVGVSLRLFVFDDGETGPLVVANPGLSEGAGELGGEGGGAGGRGRPAGERGGPAAPRPVPRPPAEGADPVSRRGPEREGRRPAG